MRTETPHFNAWLAAEQSAQAAERELHAAMLNFVDSPSEPLLPDMILAARARRAEANALFELAIQEMKTLAESLHHRRIVTSSAGSLQPEAPRAPSSRRDGSHGGQMPQHGE